MLLISRGFFLVNLPKLYSTIDQTDFPTNTILEILFSKSFDKRCRSIDVNNLADGQKPDILAISKNNQDNMKIW